MRPTFRQRLLGSVSLNALWRGMNDDAFFQPFMCRALGRRARRRWQERDK